MWMTLVRKVWATYDRIKGFYFCTIPKSNKERKEERKKQWLVNVLFRFSVIDENRCLCLTSSFFVSHMLKSLRQTNARIQVFIGPVSYRWFDWRSSLMKSKFSWRLLCAILIFFFFFFFFVITLHIIYLWVQYNGWCILSKFSSHLIESTGTTCLWNNLPH